MDFVEEPDDATWRRQCYERFCDGVRAAQKAVHFAAGKIGEATPELNGEGVADLQAAQALVEQARDKLYELLRDAQDRSAHYMNAS
jgi:hypothetical protein